ncbi:ATP-binding cassette domain-containing protein [uncultured Desulfosarcina sp.]|uniref:ABC transporter ATP-binding protein n=1 Tax=uncultured Desulfosarcina sp. TaxID=218289 RepID=UPI0029C68492|nr:ATP-binding cassette domain-containing protein [uncultured Desulfosarcina sp.]
MIALDNVSYAYPFTSIPAVSGIDLRVRPGEAVLVTGPSGCGKSTLIRLVNGLCPHFFNGRLKGRVRVAGKDTTAYRLHEISNQVGTLFQDPEHQFFAMTVAEEIAFVHEWRQTSPRAILKTVRTAAERFGLTHLLDRSLLHLSEGEKQKVVLASIVSCDPRILVLDEPTANLDPEATADLAATIKAFKQAGMAILIVDHRLYWLESVVDRVLIMDRGRIAGDGSFSMLNDVAVTSAHGLRKARLDDPRPRLKAADNRHSLLRVENLGFAYKSGPSLFHGANINLAQGVTALLGQNGSGKTTLARLLTGLSPMDSGRLYLGDQPIEARLLLNRASIILQNVDHQLHMKTVREELIVSAQSIQQDLRESSVEEHLDRLGLRHLAERHPQSLSGGEKQRLVIACGMIKQPDVLILDEPTSGLDGRNMALVVGLVRRAADQGACVVLISHDLELIGAACDHALRLPLENEEHGFPS